MNPDPPTISILMATYNRASLIGETLASIQAQTLTDWECIVVDDGSTDDTRAVVERWAAQDSRFRYVWQENAKLHHARMKGASVARGTLMAWIDDDDVWLPTYLETVSRPLRERPNYVLAAAARLFWDGRRILDTQRFRMDQLERPLSALIRHCFLVPSQCIARRAAFDRTPGFRVDGSCDYDVWLQLAPLGDVLLINTPLVKYRVHDGSFSVADAQLRKRRQLTLRHMQVLGNFLERGDITLHDRLLAMGNIQRKHEQLLEFDLEEGNVSRSRLFRVLKLLSIVPSPILRNPYLARQYLTFRSEA